jgi:hypothetical protein
MDSKSPPRSEEQNRAEIPAKREILDSPVIPTILVCLMLAVGLIPMVLG